MRAKTQKTIGAIALAMITLTAPNVFAYYNPSTGTWLSRDPVGEPGFQLVQAAHAAPRVGAVVVARQTSRWIDRGTTTSPIADFDDEQIAAPQLAEPNLYGFVLSDPANRVDPLGLISFSRNCSAAQQAELTAAWNKACQLVNDPQYQCCLNRAGLTQLLKRRCSWGNLKFTCNTNQSGICGITMGGTQTVCAHAFRSLGIGRGEIVVCYPGVYACGNVSCTLLHEMGHVLGRPFHTGPVNDNRPDSLANCCKQYIR